MTGVLDELATGRRFGKFASVGAVGAVIDLSISATLTLATALPPELAKVVGAEAAIVTMFLINDRWTFPDHGVGGGRAKLRRLLRSNLVRAGGVAIQVAVVFVLTRLDVVVTVAGTNVWDALTMPIAIGAAFLVNYVAESLFTWRVADDDDL
ncbi:GtrA family protein [Halorubrum sp. JWXQ-INN 858]|uniref:GtrA family protein n=1 Tax=Halorubrum sp. JWXQ-INN 858 TaxID=2690782 RepID=UPI00135A13A6|nr:GtrA family protein [Halorubrum sp. JWXQ-INN 858]MWV65136.1 GtrA family protein [Halorubrum sp. JWXQ-INN 858]